jgi:hypothetical protein
MEVMLLDTLAGKLSRVAGNEVEAANEFYSKRSVLLKKKETYVLYKEGKYKYAGGACAQVIVPWLMCSHLSP